MRTGLVLAILLLASTAHADERRTAIDVQAGLGPVFTEDAYYDSYAEPETATMLRARFGWETAPVPYPVAPGYAWAGKLVPELTVGMIDHQDKGEGFVQAGVRLEVLFAQKEQGLFRVSARGGMWLAARAGVLGEYRDTMWEGAFGSYLWLGHSKMRVGWEMGLLGLEGSSTDYAQPLPGAVRFDTGYSDRASSFQFSIFLGGRL